MLRAALLVVACAGCRQLLGLDDPGSGAIGDARSIDAAPDAADNRCWPYDPLNYAPCAPGFPAAGPLPVESIDTDTTQLGIAYTFGGSTVRLIHVASWSLSPIDKIAVTGTIPLLVVSDGDVTIDGTIEVMTTATAASCPPPPAPAHTLAGTGGSAGGFGTAGGGGGASGESGPGIAGGPIVGNAMISPLRSGCPGAPGEAIGAVPGGMGGAAGGAIQISSATVVSIGGEVYADGLGGRGGMVTPAFTGGAAVATGGGGGGAGGAILVEAPTITVTQAGRLCAAGGGGGQGAAPMTPGGDGGSGTCASAPGGSSSALGGFGGASSSSAAPGFDGGSGIGGASPSGGGGGGGGAGRIALHEHMASVAGVVVPPPGVRGF